MAEYLNVVVQQLNGKGYKVDEAKSLNLIRAMKLVVSLRNKVAHGSLGPVFFNRIEDPLRNALTRLMDLVPFSKFVVWGRYAGRAVEFVEKPSAKDWPSDPPLFWVKSDLLSYEFF